MAKSGEKTCFDVGKIGFCNYAAILQTQVPKLCTALDLSLLYILILGTYSNSLGKIISYRSAFAFRSSARALAADLPRQDHVYKTTDESFRFHNKNFDEISYKLDSTEDPRSFEKYPTPLKVALGISRTNADPQRNPVYNAFHRKFGC